MYLRLLLLFSYIKFGLLECFYNNSDKKINGKIYRQRIISDGEILKDCEVYYPDDFNCVLHHINDYYCCCSYIEYENNLIEDNCYIWLKGEIKIGEVDNTM